MDSQAPATAPVGSRGGRVRWPVWCGVMPPLANGFSFRPETAPGVERTLASRVPVVLTGSVRDAPSLRDARGACGKTQLAVLAAQSLWQVHQLDLLVWVDAATRASLLTGYVDAARAVLGTGLTGTAESIAARFASWLSEATRPWLVVLDDLSSPEVLDGLWPEGPEGAVLITTANPAATFGERGARAHPVPAFSTREALNYIMGRLTADTDQRLGAMGLVEELRGEPLALAQAAAVLGAVLQCQRQQPSGGGGHLDAFS
jgi:hypothetical protein